LDLREKIVESVKKGVPKSETARRFGIDRATVKRLLQAPRRARHLSREPRKAPGKAPKLYEKARKLLVEDLEVRPWATHSQRAQFLLGACGVSVSEATICRTLRRLWRTRKKIHRGTRTRRVLEAPVAHGTRPHRDPERPVFVEEMGPHTSLWHLCMPTPHRREGVLRGPQTNLKARTHDAA
jgi:transposase